MSIRLFFLLFLWSLATIPSTAQIIADFNFNDTSNMPESLKKNAVGPDAHSISTYARSNGEGVYTIADPNTPADHFPSIDLAIPEEILNHTESIYLEFDYRSQEEFAWLFFSGFGLFRFAHANYPDDPSQQGFHVRYATQAAPENLISSGYVGTPLQKGERAVIGFMYDKESGTAHIFKDGQELWQTPDDSKTPGHALHWQTADGFFRIGSNMNGDGTDTPSLYRFRAFQSLCVNVLPPYAEGTACEGEPVTFTASGGEEGQYRWYLQEGEVFSLIEGAVNSTYTTPHPYQSESFYVSIATEDCESPLVPVVTSIIPKPKLLEIEVTEPCGPGAATITWERHQGQHEYVIHSRNGSGTVQRENSITFHVNQDTVIYITASNGTCESEPLPIQVGTKELPSIDAGLDRRILKGEQVDLFAQGNYENLYWEAHESLQYPDSPTPSVSPKSTQTYVVRVVNTNGCEDSDSVTVYVLETFPVPNAFSPNQDGKNDTWEIPDIENYPNCKVFVFNRWGNEIFSSEGYQQAWDGSLNGNPLPFGIYYYTLQLSEKTEPIKGQVMILR